MRRIETDIGINAPPAAVWAVLTDLAGHAAWNPFITRIDGMPAVGSRLTVHIAPPGGKAMVFRPVVLAAERDRHFRWRGRLLVPGLFDGEHWFRLEPRDGGSATLFRHGEDFSGLLPAIMGGSIWDQTREGFARMNAALKQRVETAQAP